MAPRSHPTTPKEKFPLAAASQLPADAIEAARTVCEDYAGGVRRGGGIPAVAAKMGMQPRVLYNKLAGDEDSHHKLTVADFIRIWLVTNRIEHLQALGRTLNCACFPVRDYAGVSDAALLDLVCTMNDEGGQFHAALKGSLADGRIDAKECARLKVIAYEWIGAIAEGLARLEGMAHG